MPKPFFFSEQEVLPKTRRTARTGNYDCNTCGLHKQCKSPKMPPHGENRLGLAVVAEAPGKDEDIEGIPLVGRTGQYLRKKLKSHGIDLDADATKLNVIQCRPPDNRKPKPEEIIACRKRVHQQIKEAKPDVILALGGPAIREMLPDCPFTPTPTNMHGRAVPSAFWKAWVVCSYHPSYFVHQDGRDGILLDNAIGLAVKKLEEGYSDHRYDPAGYDILEDVATVRRYLAALMSYKDIPVAFDYEATSANPFDPNFQLLSVAFAVEGPEGGTGIPLRHPQARWTAAELKEVEALLAEWLRSPCQKVIQNWQFEELVSRRHLGTAVNAVAACTMNRSHVLDERQGTTGLEFQVYARYGDSYKGMVDHGRMAQMPLDIVMQYNCLDARYTLRLHQDQEDEGTADNDRAYDLFHEALPVMISCEERGLKVDVAVMSDLEREATAELDGIADARKDSECLRSFERKYRKPWLSTSNPDKQKLFYDMLGFEPLRKTKTGWSVDADSLEHIQKQAKPGSDAAKLIAGLQDEADLNKLIGTYLRGLRKLVDGQGFLHPSFNLHIPETYRSSSSGPNFQNFPVRKPQLARVRRGMVPRFDYLLECDYGGIELCTVGMYSRDPVLIKEIRDGVDPHRYWASRLFERAEEDIDGETRFKAKGDFVFATIYGSYFENTSKRLGLPVSHVRKVEGEMRDRWRGVFEWQEELVKFYEEHGYVETFLGFRRHAPLSKNQIVNTLTQATAFHLLLDALVRIEREMQEAELESLLIGQIHDSGDFDVTAGEADRVMEIADRHLLAKRFDWQDDVPLKVDWKIGRNFLDVEPI